MAFKLIEDVGLDIPVVVCDVCAKPVDFWRDLASGARGTLQSPGAVVIHHAACPTTEILHVPLIEFFSMIVVRCRIGDVGSDGVTEKATVEFPINGGFRA
jgi:hypothetical protein